MALSLKPGFLGQGKNVQGQLFILCKVENGSAAGYPLCTFEENYGKGGIGPEDKVSLLAHAYGSNHTLMGPYRASVINKFAKRLLTLQDEGKRGAYDPEAYMMKMRATSNFSGLVKVMDEENSTVKFQ